jgi:hypothetical protein
LLLLRQYQHRFYWYLLPKRAASAVLSVLVSRPALSLAPSWAAP